MLTRARTAQDCPRKVGGGTSMLTRARTAQEKLDDDKLASLDVAEVARIVVETEKTVEGMNALVMNTERVAAKAEEAVIEAHVAAAAAA